MARSPEVRHICQVYIVAFVDSLPTRLHITSEALKDTLSKKKDCEVLPNDKLLPLDALGVIMIQHGEEFGDESAFGLSLSHLYQSVSLYSTRSCTLTFETLVP